MAAPCSLPCSALCSSDKVSSPHIIIPAAHLNSRVENMKSKSKQGLSSGIYGVAAAAILFSSRSRQCKRVVGGPLKGDFTSAAKQTRPDQSITWRQVNGLTRNYFLAKVALTQDGVEALIDGTSTHSEGGICGNYI